MMLDLVALPLLCMACRDDFRVEEDKVCLLLLLLLLRTIVGGVGGGGMILLLQLMFEEEDDRVAALELEAAIAAIPEESPME